MTDLRILIVDDEAPARRRIAELVDRAPGASVLGSCENGRQAIEEILRKKPDAVFLDVQMPGLSGFDVLHAIGVDNAPAVVFVTAYEQHAVRAFEHAAVDYLLKPFDDERFAVALARVRERLALHSAGDLRGPLLAFLRLGIQAYGAGAIYARRVAARAGDAIRLVDVQEIEFIEASGPYVELHLSSGESVLHRERMHVLEDRLDPASFCRIHRSLIVRLSAVCALAGDRSGEPVVRLRSGITLKVSRTRLATLQERLGIA